MRLFGRICLVGMFALAAGLFFNQMTRNGIRWRQLQLIFPSAYAIQTQSISADSALILMFEESAIFIDIRRSSDYDIDHIPTSLSIPFQTATFESLPVQTLSEKPVIIYDYQPDTKEVRAYYKMLHKRDVSPLLLDGGFAQWLEKGYPAEIGKTLQ